MTDSSKPSFWSFQKIKDAFFQKPVSDEEHAVELKGMSNALLIAVKKVFFEKSKTKFSPDPTITSKPVVDFGGRLRIDGMEKFNLTTVVSVVHYYENAKQLEARKPPVGLLIIYVDKKMVPEVLRLLQYPYIDFEDDRDVLDGAGAMLNLIAGQFKNELKAIGYADLEMSHFQSYINNVVQGVEYPPKQADRFELSFSVDNKKVLVVEMVMAPLPKRSS